MEIDKNYIAEIATANWHIKDNLVYIGTSKNNFVLNDIGSDIWRLLDGYRSMSDICDVLMERDGVNCSKEECLEYVIEFVGELLSNSFVGINDNLEEEW